MRLLFIESGDLDPYMFCALLIILSLVMKLLCSENLHVKGTNITSGDEDDLLPGSTRTVRFDER